MTSLDIRNNSAVMKRAEQLKRWEESDTNQQPPVPRPDRGSRIKFSSGCIFLAACLAGDKEEVLKLLEQGADINTANVDGLTALHQACIDDNLEMVEFLVEQGADINRQDNEGWTPLHATASCGFVSIARYLVEHGADVAAVNSDGDLAVDLAVDIQHLPMIDFMQKMVAEQQIDCAKARQAEQQQMLADAKKWLRSDASEIDRPHPKTGATALHVAAAKGYTKVLSLLLAGRANVDAQDNDGWTPLHAAAHWGQKEAAQMLLDAMADMDAHNYAGQTCIDVADRKMVKYLEEYRANNKRIKRRPSSQISRISDTIENHMDKTPPKIIRVEVRPDNNKDHPNDDKTSVQKTIEPATDDEAPWRRNNVARVRTSNDSPSKNLPDVIDVNKTTTATSNSTTTETTDVILRRTQSFENDEKKSPPVSPAVSTTPAYTTTTNTTASPAAVATPIRRSFVPPVRDEESETQRKAHAKRVRETRRSTQGVTLDEIKSAEELVKKKNSSMNNNNNNSSSFKLEDANAGNTYPPTNSTIIPSAPAVIAAANSMSQRRINNVNAISSSNTSLNSIGRPVSAPPISNLSNTSNTNTSSSASSSTNNTTSSITSGSSNLKSDDKTTDNSSTTNNTTTTSSSGIGSSYSARRASANTSTTALNPESSSTSSSVAATTAATTSTSLSNNDDKDNDKENDNRSALATQAVIQRRRKPKRRSTGVVHIDMDELDPEKQDSANDNEDKDKEKESGSENRGSRSRAGSTVSVATSTSSATDDKKTRDKTENSSGDNIDYKALWEAVKLENEKLRAQLKKKDEEVIQTRATLERFANATNKNSLSEIEKRERRAMERKLSELEEELKLLQKLKNENERLRAENRALTRVVSKLTSSAQSQLSKANNKQ
ncbi:myosin binding subunit isoform X34 [Musca autumnalis]|uniref:myosin binding subunit isoform X34 n=1 Tax=Musca autumnalis TaxID=221902 RepID=UPI003CE820CA